MKKRILTLVLALSLALSFVPAATAAGYTVIVQPKYHRIERFSEGMAAVTFHDWDTGYARTGFIDTTGREVIPTKYNWVRAFSDGLALVSLDGKLIFINKSGNEVMPLAYVGTLGFSEGLAGVWNDDKCGFIDKSGNVVIPLKYDVVTSFSGGLAAVWLDDKWSFIDKTGNEILPLKYDWVEGFSEGLAAVCLDGKWGFIDKTGKEIIPLKFDSVMSEGFVDGYAMVELDGEWIAIDKSGNRVSTVFRFGLAVASENPYEATLEITHGGVLHTSTAYEHSIINATGNVVLSLGRAFYLVEIVSENLAAVLSFGGGGVQDYFGQYWGLISFGGGTPPTPANPLDTAASWARDGITAAIGKGFVPDDLQGSYSNVITRAEFCRMAVKWVEYALGKNIDVILTERGLSRSPNPFTDTTDPVILAAYALDITAGTSATTFNPNGQFNRQQAATMILNTARAIGADVSNPPTSDFTDLGTADTWAHPGINFVRAHGIMSGTSTTAAVFSPWQTYTRQQSIVTFNNINHNALPGGNATTPGVISAKTYRLPLTPDHINSNIQNMWYLPGTEIAGQIWDGSIPADVLPNMTKIEVFMPHTENGLVAVLGGSGNWWASTDTILWKDGKVTINSSDFPALPSSVFFQGYGSGYLVIVDGGWTKTWSELGVTEIIIHYE